MKNIKELKKNLLMLLVNCNCKLYNYNLIFNNFFKYSVANTEQFKDLKKTFFDMELKQLNDAENNLNEQKSKLPILDK